MHQITIEENIRRILKTNKLTKTLRPTFGLDRHVDRQISLQNLSYLKEDIVTQLKLYEPRITLKTLNLTPRANGIDIAISYILKHSGFEQIVRIEL